MKKLLIVLLVVAMMLSLASMAFAATFSTWMGGRLYMDYKSNNNGRQLVSINKYGADEALNGRQGVSPAMYPNTYSNETIGQMTMTCQVTQGNSFAGYKWVNEVFCSMTKFDQYFFYFAGQKNLLDGTFDWQFNTGNVASTIMGQPRVNAAGNQGNGLDSYGGFDPMFYNRPKQIFALSYHPNTNLTVNAEVSPNSQDCKSDDGNYHMDAKPWVVAITYKFDANNKVYGGYSGPSDTVSGLNWIVGGQMVLGDFATLKGDYWQYCETNGNWYADGKFYNHLNYPGTDMVDSGIQPWKGYWQFALNVKQLKTNFVPFYAADYNQPNNNYGGIQIDYSGFNKITLGTKYFTNTLGGSGSASTLGQDVSKYGVYAIYYVGAFDFRAGYTVTDTKTDVGKYWSIGVHASLY